VATQKFNLTTERINHMNTLKIILLTGLAFISFNVSAFDDKQVTYDGKGIVITDVYNGKGTKINTSKLQKGVYEIL
jgi:hypothetical protein